MFDKKKPQVEGFAFDLETEIKNDPAHAKKLLEKVDHRIHAIKKILREGTSDKDFENWGILLHGYTALQKTLKRTSK